MPTRPAAIRAPPVCSADARARVRSPPAVPGRELRLRVHTGLLHDAFRATFGGAIHRTLRTAGVPPAEISLCERLVLLDVGPAELPGHAAEITGAIAWCYCEISVSEPGPRAHTRSN